MYIKTKDGIEKVDKDWQPFMKQYANNRQADTIEELCEKNYCIVEWRNGIETICPYDLAQTLRMNCPDKINGAYLCVFTKTGLTKTARITENGGAELL